VKCNKKSRFLKLSQFSWFLSKRCISETFTHCWWCFAVSMPQWLHRSLMSSDQRRKMRVTICFSFGILYRLGLFCSLSILNTATRIRRKSSEKFDNFVILWMILHTSMLDHFFSSKVFKVHASQWPNTPYLTRCCQNLLSHILPKVLHGVFFYAEVDACRWLGKHRKDLCCDLQQE